MKSDREVSLQNYLQEKEKVLDDLNRQEQQMVEELKST